MTTGATIVDEISFACWQKQIRWTRFPGKLSKPTTTVVHKSVPSDGLHSGIVQGFPNDHRAIFIAELSKAVRTFSKPTVLAYRDCDEEVTWQLSFFKTTYMNSGNYLNYTHWIWLYEDNTGTKSNQF